MNRPIAVNGAMTLLETSIHPRNHLAFLSQHEVDRLINRTNDTLYPLIRSCALAVLNSGISTDDSIELFAKYPDFDMEFERRPRGLQVNLKNAPAQAFVDGTLIETIHDQLFAVLRDLLHSRDICQDPHVLPSRDCSNLVFQLLRNAKVLESNRELSCIVCWGGHSINQAEYDYSQAVGQELGLRRLDICTGCGSGAMKGPMFGAIYSHKRQKYTQGRFIGISEPGIIAAEPPNGVVSELVIMPDIEKRLEAFVRIAHGIVIFPGGAGTIEEILYLLAILGDSRNAGDPLPVVLTGPASSLPIIQAYIEFITLALGPEAISRIATIIDDPVGVAEHIQRGREQVKDYRLGTNDAYYFNWTMHIPSTLRSTFVPTHESMLALQLDKNQQPQNLACELRRLFSGIVAGNVKPEIRQSIDSQGPFKIKADPQLISAIDQLLNRLINEKRMKMDGDYQPCYQISTIN